MRFDAFKNEAMQHEERDKLLRKIGSRQWVLGDLFLEIRVNPDRHIGGFPSSQPISLSISVWRKDDTGSTEINGRRYTGGYFDHAYHALDVLTSDQLHRVATCREVVEEWIAGEQPEFLELPTDAPTMVVRPIGALDPANR